MALLGTAAVLAGCGGEPAAVTDKDAVLRLKLDEYTIVPQVVRVVATSDPMPIKIVATNIGRLTHNVKVERDEDAEEPDDTAVLVDDTKPLGGTPTAQPGQVVRTEEPIPLSPGRYRLTDSIGNHDNLGQYGTLIVEPPPSATP
ncbi:MAG: hypothetical protein JWP18_2146 [Solirubrobacterales bacterium]|jgi:hypothetical protein|nr:hypothetical protein [Solirubrobacterales bacterium]